MGTIYNTDHASMADLNPAAAATVGAAPASGTLTMKAQYVAGFARLTFTLTAARIAVTDSGGTGSYGTMKLADMVGGGWHFISSRQDYTAFLSDDTGVKNNCVFDIGVGTVAIAAAEDGILTGFATQDDIGIKVDVTLSASTGTGTGFDPCNASINGTGTDVDINLNWSGTAATVDANGTIDVTGTITVIAVFLEDD